jgi:hypothetical protein
MVEVGRDLLNHGYEPAFAAGMLAQIQAEGDGGMFERSNYSNPANMPAYLAYMVNEHEYHTEYDNQNITSKNLSVVRALLEHLKTLTRLPSQPSWEWRGGFGLGCIQWTFDRTLYLMDVYSEVNGNKDTITRSQVMQAECLMVRRELENPPRPGISNYRNIRPNWQSANSGNLNSTDAAFDAGHRICRIYVGQTNTAVADSRGGNARDIYNIMMR